MKAIIFANGPVPELSRIQQSLEEADLILCADGGANRAMENNITPDFVIGDLDSINPDLRLKLAKNKLIFKASQQTTDLEKTLQFALENSVTKVTATGISGGRLDHQINNLNILEKFSDRLEINIIDKSGTGIFVRDKTVFKGIIGQQISLIAFRQANGITTKGLKFPLNNESLEWAVRDGLSNEIVSNPVEIEVKEGILFVLKVRQ